MFFRMFMMRMGCLIKGGLIDLKSATFLSSQEDKQGAPGAFKIGRDKKKPITLMDVSKPTDIGYVNGFDEDEHLRKLFF